MGVRWSPLQVKEKLDKIEEYANQLLPTLEEAKKVATEAEAISNLPEYMKQRLFSLRCEVESLTGGVRYNQPFRGRIHAEIERIRKDLPQGDLAKEQASFQKWLDLFDGDKEKALVGMSLGRPPKAPIPVAIQAGYNPVGEAIEFFEGKKTVDEESQLPEAISDDGSIAISQVNEPSEPVSVASEAFADDVNRQSEIGTFIDELNPEYDQETGFISPSLDEIGTKVAEKFNVANDTDLRDWIEEYLDHWDEIHSGMDAEEGGDGRIK